MGSGKGLLGRKEGIQTDCEELVPFIMTTVGCVPLWVSSEWRERWENSSSAGSLPVPASAPGLEAAPGLPLWTATPATQNPRPQSPEI